MEGMSYNSIELRGTKTGYLKVKDIFTGQNVHGTVCARKPVSRRQKIATILGKTWEEEMNKEQTWREKT
jgi:hypothetical protein